MNFDDFMEKILTDEMLMRLCTFSPAKINIEMDDKGNVSNRVRGNYFSLKFLVAMLIRDLVKKTDSDIDKYFDELKEYLKVCDKLDEIDKDKTDAFSTAIKEKDIESLRRFNEMFKDLGL